MSELTPEQRRRQVVELREGGATFTQIGALLGVSRQRANQLYTEATWPTDRAEADREAKRILRAAAR